MGEAFIMVLMNDYGWSKEEAAEILDKAIKAAIKNKTGETVT
jgi:hypothetical protein